MSGALYDAALRLALDMAAAGLPPAAMAEILAHAVAARPDDDAARAALAGCRWETGAREQAIALMREAAARQRGEPELRHALARMLLDQGHKEEGEALAAFLRARMAANANLHAARAEVLLRLSAAVATLQGRAAALALAQETVLAHLQRADRLLLDGDLEAGWAELAWRLRDPTLPGVAGRAPHGPLERPDPAAWRGRTVLLCGELGHGDMIQCLRYVPLVRAAGAEVALEVQPALVRLARTVPGAGAVVAWGEAVPPHDVALPMFHLPWAFGTTPDRMPGTMPYLRADPAAAAGWQARLGGLPGVKVGLVWAGEPRAGTAFQAMDEARSLPLAALAPLAAVPGVSFVSLQTGSAAAQAATPPPGLALHDWTAELCDFADTAALMAALDLVITVDTACVHLAGALGRPVWLLNRFHPCWRWQRAGEGSPWYPTLRQFRQAAPGDWAGVAARAAAALAGQVGRA